MYNNFYLDKSTLYKENLEKVIFSQMHLEINVAMIVIINIDKNEILLLYKELKATFHKSKNIRKYYKFYKKFRGKFN